MEENIRWHRQQLMQKAASSLTKNGFRVELFESRDDATGFLVEQAQSAQTVGFGGSVTLAELGLIPRIEASGVTTLVHGRPGLTPLERRQVMRQQLNCDLFFTGTNALTLDGCIVNIDASGNRVCAMAFGPKQVWIVAGANKLTKDIPAALRRVREVASPPNAKRLGFKTPCANTGICCDCDAPDRICRITTIIERKPRASEIGICLINDSLGY